MTQAPLCPYCSRAALLTTGAVLYPGKPKLAALYFWHCEPCAAWVGCHPAKKGAGRPVVRDRTIPLGTLANADLHRWRTTSHRVFDELWRSGAMSRSEAYLWMGRTLELRPGDCHIGSFDMVRCKALVEAVVAREG